MDAVNCVTTHRPEIELFYHVQFLEEYVPTGIGRGFVDGVAFIAGGDGLLPSRAAVDQVLQGQKPALLLAEIYHCLGDRTFVKSVPATVNDGLECPSEVFLIEHLPRLQWLASRGENGLRCGEFADQGVAGNDPR